MVVTSGVLVCTCSCDGSERRVQVGYFLNASLQISLRIIS